MHGRVAGRHHRITDDKEAVGDVRKPHEVLHRPVVFIAVHADMPHTRRRHELQKAVTHSEPGTQHRHDHLLFAGKSRRLHRSDRGFNMTVRKRQITREFVAHQHGDFMQQLTKHVGTRLFLTHDGEFVLNQRMINDMKSRETGVGFHINLFPRSVADCW